mmetsp:Transcript_20949/g.48106  ORF Transcript_20949/g.48106 Transcript_20949/m.48106 type:complete len:492 (+) Transcript_20949:86-1561(+)
MDLTEQALEEGLTRLLQEPEKALEEALTKLLQERQGSCPLGELGITPFWLRSPLGTQRRALLDFISSKSQVFSLERKNKNKEVRGTETVSLVAYEGNSMQQSSKASPGKSQSSKISDPTIRAFTAHLEELPDRTCDMLELAQLPAWLNWGSGQVKLKKLLEGNTELFSTACKGDKIWVRLRQPGELRSKRQPTMDLNAIDAAAMLGKTVHVDPSAIRWTHCTLQRMFTCGRRLVEVAYQLKAHSLNDEDLPTIEIIKHDGKWYSRNNRRLWCFKEARLSSVKTIVGKADVHFLQGLTTVTDGLSVGFFPAVICSRCGVEFPNRKGLQLHACSATMKTSALDWDDMASEASDESGSEAGGDYGEDGSWYTDEAWSEYIKTDECWHNDAQRRGPLWRAAASGNHRMVSRLLEAGAAVDACDSEGVSPMLAAVRRGHWCAAKVLLWHGAYQKPWTLTARKGKNWSSSRAQTYERLVNAVNKAKKAANHEKKGKK